MSRGFVVAATTSAAAPLATAVPLPGVDGAPWWAILIAAAAGPAVTYAVTTTTRAGLAASAAALEALAGGKGWKGALGAAASSIRRSLEGAQAAPQLPPSTEPPRDAR